MQSYFFQCINIARSLREILKTTEGLNINAWKTLFDPYNVFCSYTTAKDLLVQLSLSMFCHLIFMVFFFLPIVLLNNNNNEPRHVILFDLVLYVPSTIFQLNRDESSLVEPVLS